MKEGGHGEGKRGGEAGGRVGEAETVSLNKASHSPSVLSGVAAALVWRSEFHMFSFHPALYVGW